MKQIEYNGENLKQIMYGLLLPAVAGTIFWYLIQHAVSGRYLSIIISFVLVYYFCLHFLSGSQIPAKHYGGVGFLLDLIIILSIEVLFYSVDGLPRRIDIGLVAVLVIFLALFFWNLRSKRYRETSTNNTTLAIITGSILVISFRSLSYVIDILSEHHAMLFSAITLAAVSTYYLLLQQEYRKKGD